MMLIFNFLIYIYVKYRPLIIFMLKDNHAESRVPDEIVRDLARLFLSHIIEMCSTEEGRKELAKWKEEQEREEATVKENGDA